MIRTKNNYNIKSILIKEKLSYIIKKFNFILNEINKELIEIDCNNLKLKIYYDSEFKPQYIINQNLITTDILEKIEIINNNIDIYERIEDVIYEICFICYNNKRIIFINELNLKKKEMFNNQIVQSKIFSKNSLFEMIYDEILNLHNNDYYIEIISFLEYNIIINTYNFTKKNDCNVKINLNINIDGNYYFPQVKISSNYTFKNKILQLIENIKPFSNKNNWNIKYSLSQSIIKIKLMIESLGSIEEEYLEENKILDELEKLFSINFSITELNKKLLNIFDSQIVDINKEIYWKKGTGYGSNLSKEWDIETYINNLDEKNKEINIYIKTLSQKIYLNNNIFIINTERILEIYFCYIESIDLNSDINLHIIEDIANIIKFNLKFILSKNYIKINKIISDIKNIYEENNIFHELIDKKNLINNNSLDNLNNEISEYEKIFNKHNFKYIETDFYSFSFINDEFISIENIARLKKEFLILKKNIINNENSSIFFMVNKNCFNRMRFIITGPKDTCYEYGLLIINDNLEIYYYKLAKTNYY